MATNEIQNGCEASIEAVLASNHKRRCVKRRSRLEIKVPSLSSMFFLVRAGYELVESSTRLYRSLILPSSAFRPLGTYPPCSRPVSIAKSSPARSAPVWPPDMIFRSIFSSSSFRCRNLNSSRLGRRRSKSLFRREATEFGQELGGYSQSLGGCRGFHFEPVYGLVHRGQRFQESVSARRHPTRFLKFAKRSANAEASLRFQAARYHQQPKSSLDLNSHGHERQVGQLTGKLLQSWKLTLELVGQCGREPILGHPHRLRR